MKPHHAITPWDTKCTSKGCPTIVRSGQPLFFDDTHAYCQDCYNRREHCVSCGKDIEDQARNYVNQHKNYCWECATADTVDNHFSTYTTQAWR